MGSAPPHVGVAAADAQIDFADRRVNASKTIFRGASSTRVITMSFSLLAAIVNDPAVVIGLLLVRRSNRRGVVNAKVIRM
jgi:hypothetical protein